MYYVCACLERLSCRLLGCRIFHAFPTSLFCYRNGSHASFSKEEAPKLNGVYDGYSCDRSTVTSLKGSKDHLKKNGYVHPLNGALKQQDNISCSKSTHQGAEFRCPQPRTEEMGTSSCPSSASDFTACIASTSPSRATHHEQIFDSPTLSEPPSAAIQEKPVDSERSLDQDQTSRVRLNGSHHIASHTTLTGKHPTQGPETGIISEFFSHSRLHHISTWRNEFSEYVNTLQSRRRAAGGAVFPGKDKLKKLKTDHCAGNVVNCSLCILFVKFCHELGDICGATACTLLHTHGVHRVILVVVAGRKGCQHKNRLLQTSCDL